jgi:hypothetical protein
MNKSQTTEDLIDRETILDAIEHARFLYGGINDLEGALTFLRCALCSEEVGPTEGDLAWARGVIEGLMKAAHGEEAARAKAT